MISFKISCKIAKIEDVVVASAGQGYTRGQAAFCMIDTYVNQSIVVLRAKKGKLNPLFLFYNLISRYLELRNISDAHSSRGSLTIKLLANLNIQLPNYEEQTKIAKILFSLDSKIELNHNMNKTFEKINNTLFQKWFVDFEFPNENGEPYKISGGDISDSELGKIPSEWSVIKLGEVVSKKKFSVVDGPFGTQLHSSEYVTNGIPVIKISNLSFDGSFNSKKMNFITKEKFNLLIRSAVYPGDILLAKTGDTIGKFSIVPSYIEKALISSSVLKISPNDEKFNRYYIYNIIQRLTNQNFWKQISSGSTRPTINLNDIKNLKIINPPDKLIKQFYFIVDSMRNRSHNNSLESEILTSIKNSLLPKLMTGKIRVPLEMK